MNTGDISSKTVLYMNTGDISTKTVLYMNTGDISSKTVLNINKITTIICIAIKTIRKRQHI